MGYLGIRKLPAFAGGRSRAMHMVRTLVITLSLGSPLMAIADARTTYHCEGDQTTAGGIGEAASTIPERVVQDYTVDLEARRYWDWKEQLWRPIHSVGPRTLVLSEETVGPGLHGWWRVSIDRDTGAWSAMWAGGQHTTTIKGQCKRAPFREPPEAAHPEPRRAAAEDVDDSLISGMNRTHETS